MHHIKHIDSQEFEAITNERKENAIVVFSKETCKVCKKLEPVMDKIAEDYVNDATLNFYHMNVLDPETKAIFKSLQLVGVPQSVFFKDGAVHEALPGALDEKILRKEIDNMLHPKQGFGAKLKAFFGGK